MPSSRCRIVLAEHHPIYRLGVRTLLENETDLEIVGEAVDGEQAIAMVKIRREEEVIGNGRGAAEDKWSDPAWIMDHMKDPQLAAAVKAAQARIDSGDWTPTGQELPPARSLAEKDLDRATRLRDRLEKELEKLDKKIDSLEAAAPEDHAAKKDLWADSVDVSGGRMDVYDKDGKLVAHLKITGNDLERWLIDADVQKEEVRK